MRTMAALALFLCLCLAAWAKPCPKCQQENPDASLFCQTCGQKFLPTRTCPECAKPAPEDARFCATCGHKFGFNATDEQRLVNEAMKARGEYLAKLDALAAFYKEAVLKDKLKTVADEAEAIKARSGVPALKASTVEAYAGALGGKVESLPEADQVFDQAEGFRKDLDPFRRQPNLLKALDLYQSLILKFPQSDKVDECAYYLGQIYASSYVGDWAKAAEYYEKCSLWNPHTDKDSRFRAAEAYEKARNQEKAAELYRLAAQEDPSPEHREVAKERLQRYKP